MGNALILTTFNDPADRAGWEAALSRMADVVREALRASGAGVEGIEAEEDVLLVRLPGGTARIYADGASFPIQELDSTTLRVLFEVAVAGDMVFITEGGDYAAIVTAPAQRKRFPHNAWKNATAEVA